MPAEVTDLHISILSGVAFFLVVGRMFWESFKSLFTDLILLLIPNVILLALFEEFDTDGHGAKMFLLLVGAVCCALYVYYKVLN